MEGPHKVLEEVGEMRNAGAIEGGFRLCSGTEPSLLLQAVRCLWAKVCVVVLDARRNAANLLRDFILEIR
jgi:hypothetical protein